MCCKAEHAHQHITDLQCMRISGSLAHVDDYTGSRNHTCMRTQPLRPSRCTQQAQLHASCSAAMCDVAAAPALPLVLLLQAPMKTRLSLPASLRTSKCDGACLDKELREATGRRKSTGRRHFNISRFVSAQPRQGYYVPSCITYIRLNLTQTRLAVMVLVLAAIQPPKGDDMCPLVCLQLSPACRCPGRCRESHGKHAGTSRSLCTSGRQPEIPLPVNTPCQHKIPGIGTQGLPKSPNPVYA